MVSSEKETKSLWKLVFLCWLVASVSTMGSLFFSEVMRFLPCVLCWYQRICMYPLVILYLIGLNPLDPKVLKFTFPLVVLGWGISFYHNLLIYEILPEDAAPCVQGVPCSMKYINWFGFMTIPMLSFIGFTLLLILSLIIYGRIKR